MDPIKQYLEAYKQFFNGNGMKSDPGLDLLIEVGRPMAVRAIGGMTPKECYSNALIRAKLEELDYIEGRIAIIKGTVVIEHAWNGCDEDFIDPTIERTPADTYFGLVIPTDIAWAVNQSKQFKMGGAGVLGTLKFFNEKRMNKYIAAIRQANAVVA